MENISTLVNKTGDSYKNGMSFIDKEHEIFYKEKLKILRQYGRQMFTIVH